MRRRTRPTAKASIEKLVAEGMLLRGVRTTARVAELGSESVRDIYCGRAYLESEILRRLASEHTVLAGAVQANLDIAAGAEESAMDVVEPDMRFPTSLVDAVGNERIGKMYRSLVSEARPCMTGAVPETARCGPDSGGTPSNPGTHRRG